MADDKLVLAVFDFDGTLTEGHMWSGIARHHREKKIKRFAIYYYLFSHLPIWFAAKFKLYNNEKNIMKWGEDLPSLIKGFSAQDAGELFEWLADEYFMSLLRPDVMQRLEEHRKQGHKTMILSGMFEDFLQVLKLKIGIDYVSGTKLEIINNVYSGRIIKPLCFGEEKARNLAKFIKEKHINVDLSRSTAYADSVYDVPVFHMVGNPVAAYPDKELYQLALKNKWPIIGSN
jgi:HAD superfamily hydrolase (TIGR01490 family)